MYLFMAEPRVVADGGSAVVVIDSDNNELCSQDADVKKVTSDVLKLQMSQYKEWEERFNGLPLMLASIDTTYYSSGVEVLHEVIFSSIYILIRSQYQQPSSPNLICNASFVSPQAYRCQYMFFEVACDIPLRVSFLAVVPLLSDSPSLLVMLACFTCTALLTGVCSVSDATWMTIPLLIGDVF